jgi:hypothetical protein
MSIPAWYPPLWIGHAVIDYAKGDSHAVIAERYGKSRQSVYEALRRRGYPPRPRPTLRERLESGLPIDRDPAQCWEWQRSRSRQGYGRLGPRVYAHRLAYEVFIGPIPDGLHVLHHCDNPPCCNPAHLWSGTVADNMRDRDAKGRNGSKRKAAGLPRLG